MFASYSANLRGPRWQSTFFDQLTPVTGKARFDYNDRVRVRKATTDLSRLGAVAWIVGVFSERIGPYFEQFPDGPVYTIEYEDGSSHEVAEGDLESWED